MDAAAHWLVPWSNRRAPGRVRFIHVLAGYDAGSRAITAALRRGRVGSRVLLALAGAIRERCEAGVRIAEQLEAEARVAEAWERDWAADAPRRFRATTGYGYPGGIGPGARKPPDLGADL